MLIDKIWIIIAIALILIFVLTFETHLFYSIAGIYNKKKKGDGIDIDPEGINIFIAQQIKRGWIYIIMGAVFFVLSLLFRFLFCTFFINPRIGYYFFMACSGVSLLMGFSQLIAFRKASKW